jgi:S-DNA-T family DNA segregation ATPase FtsK/SpoIIIE
MSGGPLRVVDLPPDPTLPSVGDPGHLPLSPGDRGTLPLPVGPGGDEGEVLVVDLLRTGGLLVAGPPGSGRSTALDAFAERLRSAGASILRLGVDAADPAAASAWVEELAGRPGVVVADDLGAPVDVPALAGLPALGAVRGVTLLAAGTAGQLSAHYQGPVATLRRGRTGVLLCPGPGDADLLGIRLPRTPLPVRPGSGWLVTGGYAERVQVARHRPVAGSGPG